MANEAHSPGAGNVKITIDGSEKELVPSLNAALTLSRIGGGLTTVTNRLERMDVELIINVVALGLNISPQNKQLPEAVYKAGIAKVSGDCILYVTSLMNAGKVPKLGIEDQGPLEATGEQTTSG